MSGEQIRARGLRFFSLVLGRLCELSPLTSRGDNVGGGGGSV